MAARLELLKKNLDIFNFSYMEDSAKLLSFLRLPHETIKVLQIHSFVTKCLGLKRKWEGLPGNKPAMTNQYVGYSC